MRRLRRMFSPTNSAKRIRRMARLRSAAGAATSGEGIATCVAILSLFLASCSPRGIFFIETTRQRPSPSLDVAVNCNNVTQISVGIDRSWARAMKWFRVNRRLGSHAALIALALQLVLSFGHTHADDLARGDGAGTVFVRSSASHPGE